MSDAVKNAKTPKKADKSETPENIVTRDYENGRVKLHSPVAIPKAGGFLWNRRMMIQMSCRGYASSQFMQPEPAKYSSGPALEATTFMQPEHSYFTHHPGRFFYVRDQDSGALFSLPYEPVRAPLNRFEFSQGLSDLRWRISAAELDFEITLNLAADDVLEMWEFKVHNKSPVTRNISIYPYFSVGYLSWMNQSATFSEDLNGIVARRITPYQKVEDYYRQQNFQEHTFMLAERRATSWCASQSAFEGEGGLHNPDGLAAPKLPEDKALYETPVAVLQFRIALAPEKKDLIRLIFGAAKNHQEITALKETYLSGPQSFATAQADYSDYVNGLEPSIRIKTPDKNFDDFVNHWLPRQMFYHGDVNRLCTDPQTRNYLQDHMGMLYLSPDYCRSALINALSQQHSSGAMPEGVLLHPEAQLKYINQIPHTDHCVWVPICLSAYLDETGNKAILHKVLPFSDKAPPATLFEHVERAMQWLAQSVDSRKLSLINQGDWCDPMNMVGHKGHGVSIWLSLASAWAFRLWAKICAEEGNEHTANGWLQQVQDINEAVNQWAWDGDWYGRGITDDGRLFGVSKDTEGRIFLNPQAWALLSGAACADKIPKILQAIDSQLQTPFGVQILAPAYTGMVEDIGRVTQKFPGSAENGSVYNHAAAFYAYALYQQGEGERAYAVLKAMLPDDDDILKRGQLPVYIPNYYRGAYKQHPEVAGRSSHLFNTGTLAWFYRCLIEGLSGLRGDGAGLRINPQLPKHWPSMEVQRHFRGTEFTVKIERSAEVEEQILWLDGEPQPGNSITDIKKGRHYQVLVQLPHYTADSLSS